MNREMVSRLSRLNETVKNIVAMDRREKIMWADLDALKQEYMNLDKHLNDKVNVHMNRMVEFEVRVSRLEAHFSDNFDRITKNQEKVLDDHATEMGFRIVKFTKKVEELS